MAYVFYDTETTGIDRYFDQILQFAAIRTDENFNETARIERRCRLRPHIIPSAGALAVTGVHIAQCTSHDLPSHYEMISELRSVLTAWSPAVFAGWNIIRFDEELFRQSLYQSLYPPFLTNTNGNTRADIMSLAQAVSLDIPEALVIGHNPRGRPIFKLDQLAPANGFDHANAHDAMADVEATIHLARLLRERAPQHWSNLIRFANKRTTITFLQNEPVVIATEARFGNLSQHALAPLGANPEIDSEFYGLDLANDPAELEALSDAALRARIGNSPRPIRRIKANQSPTLKSWEEVDEFAGIEIDELVHRAEMLHTNVALKERLLSTAVAAAPTKYENVHIEQQIYGGFPSPPDKALMEAFHTKPWTDRHEVIARLSEPKLREIGQRLICEHALGTSSDELHRYHDQLLSDRLLGVDNGIEAPWRTIQKARSELAEVRQSHPHTEAILSELASYLDEVEAQSWRRSDPHGM